MNGRQRVYACDAWLLQVPCSDIFESETIYLLPTDPVEGRPDAQDHIRKRTDRSGTTVYVQRKRESKRADNESGTVRVELTISKRQYKTLKQAAQNPQTVPLHKKLQSFQWNNTYYEINDVLGLEDVRGMQDKVRETITCRVPSSLWPQSVWSVLTC